MRIPIYQIDAFGEAVFQGNPAAICPLESWLPDSLLQSIAEENNLAETAYVIREDGQWHIRWFTPKAEVDLCGHATLATAYLLRKLGKDEGNTITFSSRSGILPVEVLDDNTFTLDFPLDNLLPVRDDELELISNCFSISPSTVLKGRTDYMLRFASEHDIREMEVDFFRMSRQGGRGAIITAPGESADIVSRCFFPQVGIPEDPATGSAQTTLCAYWAAETGKSSFTALQLSERVGSFRLEKAGDRCRITGKAFAYLSGELQFDL